MKFTPSRHQIASALDTPKLDKNQHAHHLIDCTHATYGEYSYAKPLFSEFTLVSVEGLVAVLKQAIPIGSIYNRSKTGLDLLIVLQKHCTQSFEQFENLLDLGFLGYPKGCMSIHSFGTLQKSIKNGNFFFKETCCPKNLIYLNSTFEQLQYGSVEDDLQIKSTLEAIFFKEIGKAISFFSGAKEFYDTQCCDLAMFMLQQSCELTYRCLLNIFRGKDIKCHELRILRKNVARFAPEVIGVFSDDENIELECLSLLDQGYIEARYNRDYTVERETVFFLLEKVDLLLKRTFSLFDDRIRITR